MGSRQRTWSSKSCPCVGTRAECRYCPAHSNFARSVLATAAATLGLFLAHAVTGTGLSMAADQPLVVQLGPATAIDTEPAAEPAEAGCCGEQPNRRATHPSVGTLQPGGAAMLIGWPFGRPIRGGLSVCPSRCSAANPAAACRQLAVDCSCCDLRCRGGWRRAADIDWQQFAHGEYVGHPRTAHVPEYRLRVDDELEIVYRLTREQSSKPYRLGVGDEIRIESMTDKTLNRDLVIQPDGTITLLLLGQVPATGRTVEQLRREIEDRYKKYYKVPAITVTPIKVNTRLEDLRASVDARYGAGGQTRRAVVTPEGTIALPVVGSVPAQGLTLGQLQTELNERYRQVIEGIEVIPVLVRRAPRYVYVLGEVAQPGRYELTGPTTVLQALAMAGSFNVGANLRQIVIFRRGEDWRLMATMVDLHGALYGKKACPAGEIWLNDSDVIIVPKGPILAADEFIELVFTRGIYGVFPLQSTISFSKLSSI